MTADPEDGIVRVDFRRGKRADAPTDKETESAGQFARLMGIAEAQRAQILRNPIPYLQEASQEIIRLRRVLGEAKESLHIKLQAYDDRGDLPMLERIETVRVTKEEYERLMFLKEIIQQARLIPVKGDT